MKRSLRNEDMISHLPEPLLLHILSSLPTKDVVATSVLSKQWRSLWKIVPKLDFDSDDFQSEDETFSEIVCKLLLSNKAPVLESLRLIFMMDKCDAMDIGMWIGIAYAHGVRKLVINVGSEKGHFKFPKSLYNCETLETLKLSAWVLIDVPSRVCLNSLRTLHLNSVNYEDDASVLNLLSGCPYLENLEVSRDEPDVESFTIAVPSLQRLTIYDDNDGEESGGYVINAPSLKYLKIQGLFGGVEFCLIENAPEFVEANIGYDSKINNENILGSLTSVKRLSLALSPLEITFPTDSIFYRLVCLELSTHKAGWWNLLLLMLSSSPKLQVLKLIDSQRYLSKHWRENNHAACGKWSQPKNVPECLLLTLETFVWEGYKHCLEEETEVAKYILRNANRLKRATFSAIPYEDSSSEEMVQELESVVKEELESVVRASTSCQLLFA
ncbi:hypothetical protein AALP_AA5G036700 [Arabis alpina]|uniref:F-box domain-containing protein n=1 Tax=Arabis alpina TaxID=50452 RepID=A0A087GUR1_ARAAL|nr:hypothetical protein AALP_AA5G036700 [Arabis alpina]